jgi:hypothetical protein
MDYVCLRCLHHTKNKHNYILHLQRKIPCPPLNCDTPTHDILKEFLESKTASKEHACKSCHKSFSHISGLSRHNKEAHSSHSQSTDNNTTVNNTNTGNQNSNINTNHSHNHTTTNSHNINAPININLNFFGHESLDHIKNDPDFLTKCLKNVNLNGIPDLLEKIHLNPTVPENINVKLKREHSPKTVYVYKKEEGGWTEMPADDILHSMIRKGVELLCIHKDELFMIKQPLSPDDQDLCDSRTNKLSAIKKRARGSPYVPIKNSFIIKLRNHKKLSTKSSS